MPNFLTTLFFTSILFFPSLAWSQSTEAITEFDQARLAYTNGDYLAALEGWEQIVDMGEVNAALYFNIGNAAYQLNRIGPAILYYEKALLLSPNDEDIMYNLGKAKSRSIDRFTVIPEPFWLRGWRYLVQLFAPAGLIYLGFFLLLLSGGFFGHQLWFSGVYPWRRRVVLLTFPLAVLFSAGGLFASYQQETQHRLVVMDAEIPLYNSASTDDPSTLVIHEGLVVKQIEDSGLWTEVRLSNGTTGWLPITATEQI